MLRKNCMWNSDTSNNTQLKQDLFLLQCIADGDPVNVKKYLEESYEELAVIACGTVTTVSGYTYENVTAIQLAYLMEDDEMATIMLPYIQKLKPEMIKKAHAQLTNKVDEVEKQSLQYKPYDFSEIVKAIMTDQTLKDSGQPNNATKQALSKFKDYFKPGIITAGKSLIKKHLQEAFRVEDKNQNLRENRKLIEWYLINVIGHLQTLVEKCFEQECSQGLYGKKTNERNVQIENSVNHCTTLTYRKALDSSLILSRDYFVEIIQGIGWGAESAGGYITRWGGWETHPIVMLENHARYKAQQWEIISSRLANNNNNVKEIEVTTSSRTLR